MCMMLLMSSVVTVLMAQTGSVVDAVADFIGADTPEEMDSFEFERISVFLERPFKINFSSVSEMTRSGLFSKYQAASLADYRERHGDVLSIAELSVVDGFGNDAAERLAPFISFASASLPGKSSLSDIVYDSDLAMRSGLKISGIGDDACCGCSCGLKYRLSGNGRINAAVAASWTDVYESSSPDACSGYLEWNFLRIPVRLLLGDYNLRFGQGLVMWNGMSINSLASPMSFLKNPSGISASWSFTGVNAFTGAAAEVCFGRLSMSSAIAFPGIRNTGSSIASSSCLPAANLSWTGKKFHMSLTHYAEFTGVFSYLEERIPDMKSGADFALCLNGVDLFSEIGYDWVNTVAAGLGGVRFSAGENSMLAVMFRCFPASYSSARSGAAHSGTKCSNETGASFSGRFYIGEWVSVIGNSGFGSNVRRNTLNLSLDVAHFPLPKDIDDPVSLQVKSVFDWVHMVSAAFKLELKVTERFRSWGKKFRTDIRADLSCMLSDRFSVVMRLNALRCDGTGLLGYAECSYGGPVLKLFFRQGLFCVDDWDDRIYAYERDAPGNYNVPAFFGRGVWASFVASWRFAYWGRLYARASATAYPLMPADKRKPGKAELKLQCVFSF